MTNNPGSLQSRSRGPTWIVAGIVVLMAAAVLFVSQQRGSTAAEPSPSPTLALTDHQVATDQGIVSFAIEGGEFVVRLTNASGTTELGRDAITTGGVSAGVMVCGPADGPTSHRYFFGYTNGDRAIQYSGPPAIGQGASDGAFLFAILPGTIGTQLEPKVDAGKEPGMGATSFNGDIFVQAIASGQRQASGCYVFD